MGGSSRPLPFPTAVGTACSSEGIISSSSRKTPTCAVEDDDSKRLVDDDPVDSKDIENGSSSGRTLPACGMLMGSDWPVGSETRLPLGSTALLAVVVASMLAASS